MQYFIADFLKEGDTALDVGANFGRIAVAMRRIVGPSGQVHAIEANPDLIPKLRADLDANDSSDVRVVHRAIFNVSGAQVDFYCDERPSAVASGLYRVKEGWPKTTVETITLDDYVAANRLAPTVVKLDVEDVEFEALQGSEELIRRYHPVILFEYGWRPDAERDVIEFLRARGYQCFDVNFYKEVDREFYRKLGSRMFVNVAAIPESAAKESGYVALTLVVLSRQDPSGKATRTKNVQVRGPGRFVAHVEVAGDPEGIAALWVKDSDGVGSGMYKAPIKHLQHHSCSYPCF